MGVTNSNKTITPDQISCDGSLLVTLSLTAAPDLITDVDTLKSAVDALTAGGNTNHADAFTKANALFDPASTNTKVIVMFTDGNTTAGDPPPLCRRRPRPRGSSSTASAWWAPTGWMWTR